MTTEIEIVTRPIRPPSRFKYKLTAIDDPYPARLVLEHKQLFFPKDLGLNKGDTVSHEWCMVGKNIYYHIVQSKHGDRIVGEASRYHSINARDIIDTLLLDAHGIQSLLNNNIASYKFKCFKNLYRELDRSGKQKNKEISMGFVISLNEIIEALSLDRNKIIKELKFNIKQ